jgi:ferredoxin
MRAEPRGIGFDMIEFVAAPITADEVKAKARALGADLVGIADGAVMDANPPDAADPRRPSDITEHDGKRAIVLAKRFQSGATRLKAWSDRNKQFTDELTISALEDIALDLVYWLDDRGHPSLAIPPTFLDPTRYDGTAGKPPAELLSARHAAVEAGLGTLGLNLQLLTPEFGPRVVLAIVLTSAEVEADTKRDDALCLGPECGRCLRTCPADAVQHWERDWTGCNKYREPNGYHRLADLLTEIVHETDPAEQAKLIQSRTSSEMFDAPGFGLNTKRLVVSGSLCKPTRDLILLDLEAQCLGKDVIGPDPEKAGRLAEMAKHESAGKVPAALAAHRRWIGNLASETGG